MCWCLQDVTLECALLFTGGVGGVDESSPHLT